MIVYSPRKDNGNVISKNPPHEKTTRNTKDYLKNEHKFELILHVHDGKT